MKIKINYIESGEQYRMCKIEDYETGQALITNVGGRHLPF